MLTIRIICIGRLKESYLREAQAEYVKRLGAFCKIEICELPEYRLPDNPSASQIEKGLIEEGQKILEKASGALIPMCIEGKPLSSVEFAKTLERAQAARLAFVIGGSNGLDEAFKREASLRVSFSAMTFPHHLFRVMLLEQIYRAAMITSGRKYHK